MKKETIQIKTTKQWDKKYEMIYLDSELYPDNIYEKGFMILTQKELNKILERTHKRIEEYNNIKPKKEAGFVIKE